MLAIEDENVSENEKTQNGNNRLIFQNILNGKH